MATRAFAATAAVAGRRAAGQSGLAVLSSSSGSGGRRGGGAAAQSFSRRSTAERQRERDADADADVTAATAAQVEAALNRKNVDVVEGDSSATLVAADAAEALRGVGDGDVAGAEDAWVPDQETGVFVPADEASGDGNGHTVSEAPTPSSVLDQVVFVREEEMEDIERPAVDVAGANAAGAE